MSSSGSEQACTLCAQGMVDDHLAAVKLGTPDDFFIFGIYIAADAKLCCGPGKHHHKGPSGQTLGLQQRGNQNIGVEDDPNHCSEGRRSRRAFRAAAISASKSEDLDRGRLSIRPENWAIQC